MDDSQLVKCEEEGSVEEAKEYISSTEAEVPKMLQR